MRIIGIVIAIITLYVISPTALSDELVHKFKSPSFSGIGTSSHYLTIENQEFSRKKAIQDDIESALLQAQRDAENTTLAKFMRNLESRIYAQISKDLVENLFRQCDVTDPTCSVSNFGSFVIEGNTINYQRTTCDSSLYACNQGEEVIIMTITDSEGSETVIVIPIGAGSVGSGG